MFFFFNINFFLLIVFDKLRTSRSIQLGTLYRVHAVRKSQDLGVPKSGETKILIEVRNSQENGCQSQKKSGFSYFLRHMESILVKNGLTFIAVILFNISSK